MQTIFPKPAKNIMQSMDRRISRFLDNGAHLSAVPAEREEPERAVVQYVLSQHSSYEKSKARNKKKDNKGIE